MIRTAAEILREGIGIIPFATMNPSQGEAIIKAINDARRELLFQLANKAYIADNNHHKVITETEILAFLDKIK